MQISTGTKSSNQVREERERVGLWHWYPRPHPSWSNISKAIGRKRFPKKMETSTETHNWKMCREEETLKHSVLYKISPLNLSLRAEEPIHKRRKKNFWSQKGRLIPRKQCLLDTTGLVHIWTYWYCGIIHMASRGLDQHWEGTWTQTSILNQESTSN